MPPTVEIIAKITDSTGTHRADAVTRIAAAAGVTSSESTSSAPTTWIAMTEAAVVAPIDLGHALGAVLRSYLDGARAALDELPGGPRGFQLMSIVTASDCTNQAGIAKELGLDRTVMCGAPYLPARDNEDRQSESRQFGW